MNILVSYNWLKEYLPGLKLSPEELAEKLSLHSQSVEKIIPQGEHLDKIVIGKILKIAKHPGADRLQLTQVEVGPGKILKIICGAKNIYPGMLVAVALIGAKVRWHGEGNLVELKKTAIRGQESEGMICAAPEISLGQTLEPEAGVIDLGWTKAKPGINLSQVLNLKDTIFEIEVTSNRPDCLSLVGLAREVAALTGLKLTSSKIRPKKTKKKVRLGVEIKEPQLCRRYAALVIEGVEVKPSPGWLKQKLIASGQRPINNIVDVTNYVMLELGEPMHAFDYENVEGQKIIVRRAKEGEKLQALDGREYRLTPNNLVIADSQKPIALAGVMGGEKFSVRPQTKTIILEAANFDPVSIRRTSRALNLLSDSSYRFEKGLSTELVAPAIWRAAELIGQLAGGKIVGSLIDKQTRKYQPTKVRLTSESLERYLGLKLEVRKVVKILNSLGFECRGNQKTITAAVPYWREGDIKIEEDLIEEIARIFGYHNLPTEMISGEIPISPRDWELFWERRIKEILAGAGLTEIYSYSFLSADLLAKCGYRPADCLKLLNPLNLELEYLRNSLVPSLLEAVKTNQEIKDQFKIFELAKVYLKRENDLPEEQLKLSGALVGSEKGNRLFYEAKGIIELLFKKLGLTNYQFQLIKTDLLTWRKERTAEIIAAGTNLGYLGELSAQVSKNFDLKKPVVLFGLDFSRLIPLATVNRTYVPLPRFPSIELDLALVVPARTQWTEVKEAIPEVNSQLIRAVELFDVFLGGKIPAGQKSLAFRVTYRSDDRTLKLSEVEQLQKEIVAKLEARFEAKLRAS